MTKNVYLFILTEGIFTDFIVIHKDTAQVTAFPSFVSSIPEDESGATSLGAAGTLPPEGQRDNSR